VVTCESSGVLQEHKNAKPIKEPKHIFIAEESPLMAGVGKKTEGGGRVKTSTK